MELFFSETKLKALQKSGTIEPDKDGYYDLVIGALNSFNNSGAWYYNAKQEVLKLFAPDSLLMRRVRNGVVRAEVGHPRQMPGESDDAYFGRLLDIDLNNTCAHIDNIWLDFNYGKNHPELKNPDMIAIIAKVKPCGGRGYILEEALKNNRANICFSIRALADEQLIRGKRVRTLREIITFDMVNEGGLLVASKWDSPACEAIELLSRITPEMISSFKKTSVAACESSALTVLSIEQLFAEKKVVNSKQFNKPFYGSW